MHKKVATVLTKTIAKIRQPTQPTVMSQTIENHRLERCT